MKVVVTFLIIILLLVGGYFIFLTISHKSPSSIKQITNQPTITSEPTSTPIDMAPSVSSNKKTTVIIRKDDSSTAVYVIPDSEVKTFIHSLPTGSTVISQSKN